MTFYKIVIKPGAERDLKGIDMAVLPRIAGAIDGLASNPRSTNTQKIKGSAEDYRLRVGSYRILYKIYEKEKVVDVFAIKHRREAYR
ncbi:MAG: hypothetical protein A3E19_03050 [Planctomycetes bacterium RIFCSPHIGHO2_12_FULL_52_36]|nr:MAG: hypothetical protein A3D89_00055 [Planctomycetes bacterium RIFCSPHIGHO2_02_FULL_52_58]OHB94304.1 MAG: hypothetical protein A3E19_03050 [Planctomycetes bacterium RIFCSPHIGHO2_12_FULL_52_36]